MDESSIQRLAEVDCSTVAPFSFNQIETYARVCKVYDADTVTIVFEWFGKFVKVNMRLEGIDAPELHSKVAIEALASKRARDHLAELILNKVVIVNLGKFDKYGRTLGKIFTLDASCVNEHLISCQYVRGYDGGKKEAWTESELERIGKIQMD